MSKVKKICGNCDNAFQGTCEYAGEISTNYTCDKWIKRRKRTCDKCADSNECEYAFDPYNTDGDCLAIK